MDDLERCRQNDEFYGEPDWYEFKHPCGYIEKLEQFFYDPKRPEPRTLVVSNIKECTRCACLFIHRTEAYCQGIKIVEKK
jgi:hypothetical protein